MTKIKVSGPATGGSFLERAKVRWSPTPDWIVELARAADREAAAGGNLRSLGEKLDGVSPSTLSAILGNTYPGKPNRIEAKVRGKLMSATVQCPVLGQIGRDGCAGYQERKFSAANPRLVRLATACPKCPNNLGAK